MPHARPVIAIAPDSFKGALSAAEVAAAMAAGFRRGWPGVRCRLIPLAAGGTSFDALYVNVNGESGYFERSLDAYGRAGEPCRRCGTPLVREAFANRSSHRCPRCQRAGRWQR